MAKNEQRSALNKHLWHGHKERGKGDLFDRMAFHDTLHVEGNEEGYAGFPPHRHEGVTLDNVVGEVICSEIEGT